MNIIVLCGGLSLERDVSISSASQIAGALRGRGHRAIMVDVFFGFPGEYGEPSEIFELANREGSAGISDQIPNLEEIKASRGQENASRIGDNVIEICSAADIVFMALHGEDGENGKLQATFDIFGIKYTGSGYLGSALAMHKGITKDLLGLCGVKTPFGCILRRGEAVPDAIPMPCVVKPCSGGSSVGVSIVEDRERLHAALNEAFRFEGTVVLEAYIAGREFSVGIIGDVILPAIEICPKDGFYDYAHKYQSGMAEEHCPADLPAGAEEKMRQAALCAFRALKMEVYGRIDFILDKKGVVYCLEGNTLPGMTPLSLLPQEAAAAGMGFDGLCEKIIEKSMEKYR